MSKSSFKSTEELIALINTSEALGDHRDEFLRDIEAKPNPKKRTSTIIIYWVYLKWAKINKVKPMDRRSFFKGLKHKYKHRQYNVYNYYYIESSHFELEESEKELMWLHLKEERKKEKYLRNLRKLRKERQKRKSKEKETNGVN